MTTQEVVTTQERKKKVALLDGCFGACVGAYKDPYAEGG